MINTNNPFIKSVLTLDRVNKELAEIKSGKRDEEYREKAKAMFDTDKLKQELTERLTAIITA